MRSLFLVSFGVAASVFAATPLTAQTPHPQPPPNAPEPPPPQLENPDKASSANVRNAAEAPLHDLNLVRQKIPPILLTALPEPYARPPSLSCRGLYVEVNQLQQALGGDFDEPDNPQNPSLTTQRGVALTIVHGASEMLLPFAGFVRTLSGAQKHDQLVVEVITAGSVRRGYLKGLGEAYGCIPPAAPRHRLVPAVPIPESRKPEYPAN